MSRRYLRPGVVVGHLLVLAASLTCLRLGWWQWDVAREARGTVQNLGYALLWPVFAGSFVYMWLRFLHLESERDTEELAEGSAGGTTDPDGPAGVRGTGGPVAGPGAPGGRDADAAGEGPSGGSDPAVPRGAPGGALRDGEAGGLSGVGGPEAAPEVQAEPDRERRRRRRAPTETYTVAVATVGGDDEDDPELAAYNQALAALAEQDRRRAR